MCQSWVLRSPHIIWKFKNMCCSSTKAGINELIYSASFNNTQRLNQEQLFSYYYVIQTLRWINVWLWHLSIVSLGAQKCSLLIKSDLFIFFFCYPCYWCHIPRHNCISNVMRLLPYVCFQELSYFLIGLLLKIVFFYLLIQRIKNSQYSFQSYSNTYFLSDAKKDTHSAQ